VLTDAQKRKGPGGSTRRLHQIFLRGRIRNRPAVMFGKSREDGLFIGRRYKCKRQWGTSAGSL